MTNKAEQETVIHWDQDGPEAELYTAHPAQARQWGRKGYPVEVTDLDGAGRPRGWRCRIPKEAVRFRRLEDGTVVKRRTGPGRQFCANDGASEGRSTCGAGPTSSEAEPRQNPAINGVSEGGSR